MQCQPYFKFGVLHFRTVGCQSVFGPFGPERETIGGWESAAAKNAIFFADLMEGWKSDAPTGNTKRLRINSFERDNERYSGFFNPDGE
ncbi:hypothetical protein LCGC14_0585280 [marine sediment metagenome]|uniref:Uncharacterized protein n=1 Tax=marine sediment metagenome TaxID=412755 RepID=A0A0F9U1D0_9ZZZZ